MTKWIKEDLGLEAMAHLSCVGEPVDRLREILDEIGRGRHRQRARAARRPAAGRGGLDAASRGPESSVDLIELIRADYDFCIGATCFPEVHPEAPDLEHDLRFLKRKVDAGATFLITQLFFDNEDYFRFVESARAHGIDVPIIAGIMPITNFEQIKRFTTHVRRDDPARSPRAARGTARGGRRRRSTELGVAYATLQCADLLARGAPGHPLLHAQQVAGDARDPVRAQGVAAAGSARPPAAPAARHSAS